MTKMSGIELSNIIREKNKDVEIVFVTGFLICTTWIQSWYITIYNKAYKNMGFIFMYTTSDLEKAMIKMSIRQMHLQKNYQVVMNLYEQVMLIHSLDWRIHTGNIYIPKLVN